MSEQHGTDKAYRKHLRDGTPTCDECREGNARRRREAYAKSEKIRTNARASVRARYAAWRMLQVKHRDEFRELFDIALAREMGDG